MFLYVSLYSATNQRLDTRVDISYNKPTLDYANTYDVDEGWLMPLKNTKYKMNRLFLKMHSIEKLFQQYR